MDSEKRRRQLAREKYERQQQRRVEARQRARRRNTVIGAAVAVVLLAGGAACAGVAMSGDGDKKVDAAASPTASPSPLAPEPSATNPTIDPASVKGCKAAAPGKPNGKQWKTEPALTADSGTYKAVLETNCGKVTLELDAAKAPHTVNSFVFLAGQKYFDHVSCHRLTTSGIYVLQCGDPTGQGSGGPGYTLPEENLEGATYPAGTVAMARTTEKHSGGSQFFLVYQDSQLPADYTPFGRITGGMDVLKNIAAGGSDNRNQPGDGAPVAGVVMNSVTATKS
ncbi:peptidylprolyl isomerase [Streptomyces sp. NPDC092296]|uniref:peptidylprolyl isomerase n=1 Tax=Streptomyces sp. NPDC092296 TaxID=3366012 RepID=UPI0037F5BFC5